MLYLFQFRCVAAPNVVRITIHRQRNDLPKVISTTYFGSALNDALGVAHGEEAGNGRVNHIILLTECLIGVANEIENLIGFTAGFDNIDCFDGISYAAVCIAVG